MKACTGSRSPKRRSNPINEADLKRKLVKEINDLPNAYARRIEDRWSVGALDVFIKLPQWEAIWAECKVIDGKVFGPTQRQFVEGKRLIEANVPAVLIGWKNGVMYVSSWVEKANIEECYVYIHGNYATTLLKYMENDVR